MLGMTRGVATLVGAAVAGMLLWVAAQLGDDTAGEYWATYGLVAAAGLAMALSQVAGGWTKWGWPRLSLGVFLLGFLPVAIVGLWVLFAHQPGDRVLETASWSDDLGIGGVVGDLGVLLGAVAFGMGLTLGFTFDTARRVEALSWQPSEHERRADEKVVPDDEVVERPHDGRPAPADEPLTADRLERREEAPAASATDHPRRVIRP
jgi:hypothetical protein